MQTRRTHKSVFAATVSAIALLVASLGGSVHASTLEVDLTGGYSLFASKSLAIWDAYYETTACGSVTAFTPLYDSAYGSRSDAFDGGFLIEIDTNPYLDGDDLAILSSKGPTLKSGAATAAGPLNLSWTLRAFSKAYAARYLVKLTNPSGSPVTADLGLFTDVGSDGSTEILGDSSGNDTFTAADRWVITADDTVPTSIDDPVVTQALWGKGAKSPIDTVTDAIGGGSECLEVHYEVKVPANSSRYMLFFAEMNAPNAAGVKAAKNTAKNFNAPVEALLTGMSSKIRGQVLNWNL